MYVFDFLFQCIIDDQVCDDHDMAWVDMACRLDTYVHVCNSRTWADGKIFYRLSIEGANDDR